jgi:four helix bundle protein
MEGAVMHHENLEVWKAAIDLVDPCYDLGKRLPADERFGIIAQMQRAAVSVPANIAERCGRDSTRDLLRHLSIAQGSLAEVGTFLVIIARRQWVAPDDLSAAQQQHRRVGRLLTGLQHALRAKLRSPITGHGSPADPSQPTIEESDNA